MGWVRFLCNPLRNSQGKIEEAVNFVRRGLTIVERVLPPDHPERGSGLNNLGILLMVQVNMEPSKSFQGDELDTYRYQSRPFLVLRH